MHEDYTMLMSLVIDGEATPDERARLWAHLKVCAVCAVTWENWKAADRLLSSAPVVQAPPDLLAGLSTRLEAYEARRRRTRWLGVAGIVLVWAAISCGVMALFGVVAIGWLREPAWAEAATSSLRHLSSGIGWTFRGAGTLVRSIGWQRIAMVLGLYVSAAGIMMMVWLWALGRSRAWSLNTIAARR